MKNKYHRREFVKAAALAGLGFSLSPRHLFGRPHVSVGKRVGYLLNGIGLDRRGYI